MRPLLDADADAEPWWSTRVAATVDPALPTPFLGLSPAERVARALA